MLSFSCNSMCRSGYLTWHGVKFKWNEWRFELALLQIFLKNTCRFNLFKHCCFYVCFCFIVGITCKTYAVILASVWLSSNWKCCYVFWSTCGLIISNMFSCIDLTCNLHTTVQKGRLDNIAHSVYQLIFNSVLVFL